MPFTNAQRPSDTRNTSQQLSRLPFVIFLDFYRHIFYQYIRDHSHQRRSTMRLQKCVPLSLLLFIADYISPAETKFVPSTIQRVHQFATRQTHSLAKDLRLAFGGVLAPRDNSSPPPAQHVVYCKTKQAPFISGPIGGNNTTSAVGGGMSSSTTSTSRQASPTGAVSNSPWKLQQSYVSFFITPTLCRVAENLIYHCRAEIASFKDGISSSVTTLPMVCSQILLV